MRHLLCALLTVTTLACEGPERPLRVELRAPQDQACLPPALVGVRLQALSDAPVAERVDTPLELVTESGSQRLGPFAPDTRGFRVSADGRGGWQGGGVAWLTESNLVRVPVLRFGRWCGLTDPELGLLPGASVVALPDGRLALLGGRASDAEPPSDRVTLVTPGEPLAELEALRLFRGRVLGSATWTGGARVLVAGGALSADGGALDTLDWIDLDSGERVDGELRRPRFDHGAARLPDGSVLLVGGAALTGLVSTAERVSFVDGEPTTADVGAAVQRRAPAVLELDDGSVVVAGGTSTGGRLETAIERWDGDGLVTVADFPPRADAAYAALEGGRVAMVGGRDPGTDAWTGEVSLFLPRGEVVRLGDVLPPLERPRAVGLGDGRLLVVGFEDRGRRSVVYDPGETRPTEPPVGADSSRGAPDALVRLANGSVAHLDVDGVELLRLDVATSFNDPPENIEPGQVLQDEALRLDAHSRWSFIPPEPSDPAAAYALAEGARLGLPRVRFSRLRLEVELFGPGDILLTRDGASPLTVTIADEIAIGDECAIGRAPGPVVLERDGDDVVIRSGDESATCELSLPERIGVDVRLRVGSGVVRIAAAR